MRSRVICRVCKKELLTLKERHLELCEVHDLP